VAALSFALPTRIGDVQVSSRLKYVLINDIFNVLIISFEYLCNHVSYIITTNYVPDTDVVDWRSTREALTGIGLTSDEQFNIFQVGSCGVFNIHNLF